MRLYRKEKIGTAEIFIFHVSSEAEIIWSKTPAQTKSMKPFQIHLTDKSKLIYIFK